MKYFDLHCDTVFELEKRKLHFDNPETHISLSQTKSFEKYEQFFAFWSDNSKTNSENRENFFRMKKVYDSQILPCKSGSFIPHIAVEGGKILDGDISMVETLRENGVQMMTLVWKGDCCIGGAHDTNNGLTPFGKKAVKEMLSCGMVPDVSHCSDKTIYETLDICFGENRPVIATHSNSRSVKRHTRNLTDEEFFLIKKTGGRVGVSLCRYHLDDDEKANVCSVIRHIEHYMSLGGEDTLCMGYDLDGIEKLPDGLTGLKDIYKISDELRKLNYKEEQIEKIFYANAKSFFANCE